MTRLTDEMKRQTIHAIVGSETLTPPEIVVTRHIKRMTYPEAAMKLAEADQHVSRCQRELVRALEAQADAMANVLDALSRIATGPPKEVSS